MATVSQVFQAAGLWQWWTQNGGRGTNPYNGVTEKGIDYAGPWGTPVAVPVGGTVLRMQYNTSSINWVVELQAADGSVWLYQHINSSVAVGQTLACGSIIGLENGLPIDQYSTGPHIEVRYCPPGQWSKFKSSWTEPWINPYAIFSSIGGTTAGAPGGGNPGGPPGGPGVPTQPVPTPVNPLAPNASVDQVLIDLDLLLALVNPFLVNTVPTVVQSPVLSFSFTDPIAWMEGFGLNLMSDLGALIFRGILLSIGLLLLWHVFTNFVDVGKVIQGTLSIAGNVAKLAAVGA